MGTFKQIAIAEQQLEVDDAYDQGWVANHRCQPRSSNPYQLNSFDWTEWDDGWKDCRDYRPEK